MLLLAAASAQGQSTFNISSATYGTAATSSIPAGINGVTLELGGTVPSAAQQASGGYLGCFYTGYGSTTAIPLALPNGTNMEPLVVPASTIQAIPATQFTAANSYKVTAYVYFVAPSTACDGTFDATLTNRYPVSVVAPSLGAYIGPVAVPQTNSATSVQAAPLTLTLPASGIFPSASTVGTTSVMFGSIASVTPVASSSTLTVSVPAAFASSAVGTTASLQVCNTFSGSKVCTTPTPAITLTVTALVASSGTVTATPNQVSVAGQTVLTAQFTRAAGASGTGAGAPSGVVTFTAAGATVAPANLILDTTATFATQTTSVIPPVALPPTHLAFQVQPINTALNTAITPAVQVKLLDSTGAVAVNATNAVTMAIQANPGESQLGGTTTVNAVNGIATFSNLVFNNLGTGYTLAASSGTLTGAVSAAFNIIPPAITLTIPSELVGINSTLTGSFTLGAPAPAGGLVVTLSSGTPANVTIAPGTVTVAAGQTTGSFTYSGVAAGNSTLSAAATGYTTGTAMTTGTAAQVSLDMIPNVGPGQTQSLALSLPVGYPAPAGGTTVTFTIANTNIATVTSSVFIPAGRFTAAANPQVMGVLIGTTTVTANAPGYAPVTRAVTVTVTAAFNPTTTSINLATSTNTSLTISAPAPPGGIKFTLSSDSAATATVPASVTVVAGATSVPISITGVASGSTTIRADSAGITEATGTVNVQGNIGTSTLTTGYDQEVGDGISLPVSPSVPTTVTLTVSDPTVLVISNSATAAGKTTLTYPNTTSSYVGTIYVQGLKVGSTTISISAPGYKAGSVTVTVDPSGFAFDYNYENFTTTTYSATNNEAVYPVLLDPMTLNVIGYATLNPQSAVINIPVTSSAPAIGTVTTPAVFNPYTSSATVTFTPVSAGTTNLNIGNPPTGFAVAAQYQQAVATVNSPAIMVGTLITGVKLQNGLNIYLPQAAPNAVTVTLAMSTATVGTISKSETVAGTQTLTFSVAAGNTFVGTIYLQGQSAGTATLTESAPGYTSGSATMTVLQSGFTYYYGYNQTFSTTTFSSPTTLGIYTAVLNPDTSLQSLGLPLNPGVGPVTVTINDSASGVGTISPGSLVFNTGDTQQNFTFTPVSAGSTNLTIVTPGGFTTPSNDQQSVATVTAPMMYQYNSFSGVKLQNNYYISLPVATPTPETVTITSSDPTIAKISTSETTAGSATVTFTTTNGSGQSIWIQGQAAGTATLTISAPGYTSSTSTITVYPSGFVMYYGAPPFKTTTFSSPNSITVVTTTLNATSLTVQNIGLPLSPGVGPVTVVLTDSAPNVGTISAATLAFNTGDTSQTFMFQPVSAGMTTLSISVPLTFSTPSQYLSGVAMVTAPMIGIGNIASGVGLQQSMAIYLPQTPPNPVTVTVTSSSPTLALLSTSATTVGTATVTFTNVTSTNVGTIYVQGEGLGTAQLTETAPGYVDGSSTITVTPAGFAFYYGDGNFTTSVSSGPSTDTVYPFQLNTGTLTLSGSPLMLNPGLGNITVPVTSSDATVGTVTNASFAPGDNSATFTFTPVGSGTATITLGTPAGFSTPSQYVTATGTVQ